MSKCPACGSAYPNRHTICVKDGAMLTGFRRVPHWLREPSAVLLALAIIFAGLAFFLSPASIAHQAEALDRTHHDNLGGILRKLACTRGDGEACYSLGFMYNRGLGVTEDDFRAAAYYSEACDSGDPGGCRNLSFMYEGNGLPKDTTLATALHQRELTFLSQDCAAGDASRCYEAGLAYDVEDSAEGSSAAKDSPSAASFYQKACDAGKAEGCYELAGKYESGKGVAKDDFRASDLYSKACTAGIVRGCTGLATKYQFGMGIGKNVMRARQLWNKACSMGDEFACASAAQLQ
jgi:TPR repeat protein